MSDNTIIRAEQFGNGQKTILIVLTLLILALSMVGSYMLFRNYQLKNKTVEINEVETLPL